MVEAHCPHAAFFGEIQGVNEEVLRRALRGAPHLKHIFHFAGSPCQDVSALNADGLGLGDDRSALIHEVPRVTRALQAAAPSAEVLELVENVQSMGTANCLAFCRILGRRAQAVCSRDFTWVRRPRLYWPAWRLWQQPTARFVQDKGVPVTRWRLTGQRPPVRAWLPQGYELVKAGTTFPAFTRPTASKQPPFRPAGITTCDDSALARWKLDKYRYPPCTCRPVFLLRRKQGGSGAT